ncbi:MAG: hypothetical protein AAFN12_17775 [Cyanobacteria bacterium J06560_2]
MKYATGSTSLDDTWDVNGNKNTYSDFNSWTASALTKLTNAGISYDIESML